LVPVAVGSIDEVATSGAVAVEDGEDVGSSTSLRVGDLWRGMSEWVGWGGVLVEETIYQLVRKLMPPEARGLTLMDADGECSLLGQRRFWR
jgi:hypothetical protein